MQSKCMMCTTAVSDAPWPEYVSEYVKGYPLCNNHRAILLGRAVTKVPHPDCLDYVKFVEEVVQPVADDMNKMMEELSEKAYKLESVLPEGNLSKELLENLGDYIFIKEKLLDGVVYVTFLEDSDFDKAVTEYILRLAGRVETGMGVHSCQGDDCTNYAKCGSAFCGGCARKVKYRKAVKNEDWVRHTGELVNRIIDAARKEIGQ